ncbi:MAG: transglycosylase domain-containing protein [Oscillospiraceae bacterium]|nr:transglycosylase domain-containing protein [Oscillospiraceae bacterium]
MDVNKKRRREFKKRKRKDNDRDNAFIVIVRVLWFLVKLAIGAAATVLLIAVIAGILFSVDMAAYLKDDVLVSSDMSLDDYSLSQTSFIYAKNPQTGEYEELQQIYATENRIWADLEEIPANLINATVAIEDKRFFEHQGVDWRRTISACGAMFFGSGDTFGGSTITQQLIKNLTGDDEVTVRRKLQEIFRALQFEKKYTKEEIIEWYLNTIYLGEGAYGVKSAANVYFAKSLNELTIAECASLISITNNPSLYDPYIRPENNRERRNIILQEMLDQELITEKQYEQAHDQELVFHNGSAEDTYNCPECGSQVGEYSLRVETVPYTEEELEAMRAEREAEKAAAEEGEEASGEEGSEETESEEESEEEEEPLPTTYEVLHCPECGAVLTEDSLVEKVWDYSYFVDTVIRDVVEDLQSKTGKSYDACMTQLKTGGYIVYATVDLDVQKIVDEVFEDRSNVPSTTSSQQLQSAIVVVDNESGDVVAMAGGVGKKEGFLNLNRATMSQRQPGSSIKPLTVYTPALEYGIITPNSVYKDSPYEDDWPHNDYGGTSGKSMTVASGVAKSYNTIAVRVLADLTPEASFEFAKNKLNLHSLVENVQIGDQEYTDKALAPLALGALTYGVTVREMANAYASFPNDGIYREARTYTKVVDSEGNVILDNEQETHRAMSEGAAWAMTFMLQNAVNVGTGTPAAISGINVAGKTGTSSDNNDRWFSGYTGYYTASCWCGFDEPEEVVLTGSYTNPAVVMWRKVMSRLVEGKENRSLYQGNFVVQELTEKEYEICTKSGKLATAACRSDVEGSCAKIETMVEIDAPTEYCTEHTTVQWCTEGNAPANIYCAMVPGNTVRAAGYWGDPGDQVCTVHSASSILRPTPSPEPEPEPPVEEPGED